MTFGLSTGFVYESFFFRFTFYLDYYILITESSWMLRNSPFRGFVYRGIFFQKSFLSKIHGYTCLISSGFLCSTTVICLTEHNLDCDFSINSQSHGCILAILDAYQVRGSFSNLAEQSFYLYFPKTFWQISFSGNNTATFVGSYMMEHFFLLNQKRTWITQKPCYLWLFC